MSVHGDPMVAKAAKLAMMANQMAQFFGSYPHDKAIAGISGHIVKFWTPKMHALLIEQAKRSDPALHPLVVDAMLMPKRVESPATNHATGDLAHADAG
jgi:formate dehydrogenase subunit delta